MAMAPQARPRPRPRRLPQVLQALVLVLMLVLEVAVLVHAEAASQTGAEEQQQRTVPVLVWSTRVGASLLPHEGTVVKTLSEVQVVDGLLLPLERGAFGATPLVAFVLPDLRSEDFSLVGSHAQGFQALARLVDEAVGGHFVAPYTTRDAEGVLLERRVFAHFAEVDATAGSLEAVLERTAAAIDQAVASKQRPVVLISMGDSGSHDAVISSVTSLVERHAAGKDGYVAFLTGRAWGEGSGYSGQDVASVLARRSRRELSTPRALAATVLPIRMDPNTMAGLMLSLILLLVMLVTFCCLQQVPGITSFASGYPAKGKVYF